MIDLSDIKNKDLLIVVDQFERDLSCAESDSALHKVQSKYTVGKNSVLATFFTKIVDVPLEERKMMGREINQVKIFIQNAISSKKASLSAFARNDSVLSDSVDVTLPSMFSNITSRHVLSRVIDDLIGLLANMGFKEAVGTDIDSEFYIFDALNTPVHHPARQMQDSFYMKDKRLLRTHTSSVQIHAMESQKKKLPLSIFSVGRVYRNDWDMTHTPMFHQLELLFVDKNITVANLRSTIIDFLSAFFEDNKIQFRFRPSFFPFTEPSMEVDVLHNNEWLEIMGCGMVNKKVFQAVGIDDSIYNGFAFGVGIERLAMLKYAIRDIRDFYSSNLGWLSQLQKIL
ncbi:phenylalanine--tRNA ligase subunit alpha [Anaplasmataceae bacterium AB001_6]|nr:phenylalanine--tRNA ligase subunit alpha [Anaplasmataceae bacterium AB001_6]